LIAEEGYSIAWYAVPTYDVYPKEGCRVYWGSHGCELPRGHKGHHQCECAYDPEDEDGAINVGGHPYYGWMTYFWGEDVHGFQPLAWLWWLIHRNSWKDRLEHPFERLYTH
jgi:hypothetical protein